MSAIANDGVSQSSLNDAGDMMPVVGVWGAHPDRQVATFSSCDMTSHDLGPLHQSYGPIKLDTVAYTLSLIRPVYCAAERCKSLTGIRAAITVFAEVIA